MFLSRILYCFLSDVGISFLNFNNVFLAAFGTTYFPHSSLWLEVPGCSISLFCDGPCCWKVLWEGPGCWLLEVCGSSCNDSSCKDGSEGLLDVLFMFFMQASKALPLWILYWWVCRDAKTFFVLYLELDRVEWYSSVFLSTSFRARWWSTLSKNNWSK